MNKEFLMGLAAGWLGGAGAMWLYFTLAGLIVTREEFYARRVKEDSHHVG